MLAKAQRGRVRFAVLAASAVVLVMSVRGGRARADWEDTFPSEQGIARFCKVVELLVPDVRYEISQKSGDGFVLSWPVTVVLGYWTFGSSEPSDPSGEDRDFVTIQPFFEPQWKPSTGDERVVIGARTTFGGLSTSHAWAVEYGGVLADHAAGGMLGAGFLLGVDHDTLWSAGVIGRITFTAEETRYDVVIDIQFPLNWPRSYDE